MLVRPFLLGVLALPVAGCNVGIPDHHNLLTKQGPAQVKTDFDEHRVTYALFTTLSNDAWVQREEIKTNEEANHDNARLLVYHEDDSHHLLADMSTAVQKGAKGAIIDAPDARDGKEILDAAAKANLKVLVLDNRLELPKHPGHPVQELVPDYSQAAGVASKAMIKEAVHRTWDYSRTGAIIFTSSRFAHAKTVADRISADLIHAGLSKDRIFFTPAESGKIGVARKAAMELLNKHLMMKNWFVTGFNDEVVVGGVRALEEAHIGLLRTIGFGMNGDGAIYDLQRPIKSGLIGSVLLPAGTIGEKASREMYDWIDKGVAPASDERFKGVLLDRLNVRVLKKSEHLIE